MTRQRRGWMLLVASWLLFYGCGSQSGSTTGGSTTDTGSTTGTTTPSEIDRTAYAVSVADSAGSYDSADVVSNVAFGQTVSIDLSAGTAQSTSDAAQTITTDGVTLLASADGSVAITKTDTGLTINSTLSDNVRYVLSGHLAGTLSVSSAAAYQLYLYGATISATSGPALDLESTQKAFIVTASGTTNQLADSATRTLTMKAAVYGKGPMIFSGDGTLQVTGSYKHGIFSNDYIRVRGGTINVAVSARDAIRSVNGFIFDDGNLTINGTGTTVDDESKGIKVEGSESTGTGRGYIVINGGYITITSVGKAITAAWDIDEDATTASTADDPSPYVVINQGVITATTTGTPYEYVTGGTTVSCSPEGIEAKSRLTINSGYLVINTSDDALNAGKSIVINGGYSYCRSSSNDAIDSNGTLTLAGGVVVAIGAANPEGPFDCDNNTFAITGGTFVGIGGTISRPTASQNTVVLGDVRSGTVMSVVAADGTSVFSYSVPQTCATMVLSSPNLKGGTQYSLRSGGTISAANLFNGLYLGSLGCSGGTAGTSFTASSGITKLGGVYF